MVYVLRHCVRHIRTWVLYDDNWLSSRTFCSQICTLLATECIWEEDAVCNGLSSNWCAIYMRTLWHIRAWVHYDHNCWAAQLYVLFSLQSRLRRDSAENITLAKCMRMNTPIHKNMGSLWPLNVIIFILWAIWLKAFSYLYNVYMYMYAKKALLTA